MAPPCQSDKTSDTKKILDAVREIFSYYFESSIFYANFKNNNLYEIFVNFLFGRDESTKSYSAHLVSSCVRVSDEICRTKGTIPKITKSNIDELFLVKSHNGYSRLYACQFCLIPFISKLWIKLFILLKEMKQVHSENYSLKFKFWIRSIAQIIHDDFRCNMFE